MTIHIKHVGSEVAHSLPLPNDEAERLWADFQQFLKEGRPGGRVCTLANGRQELAVHFASVATLTKTTGDEKRQMEG